MKALCKYSERLVDSVYTEKESMKQLEHLLNAENIHEANNLLNTTIKLNKKSNMLEKLTTDLLNQTSELDLCIIQQVRIEIMVSDRDLAIEMSELVGSTLDAMMKKNYETEDIGIG